MKKPKAYPMRVKLADCQMDPRNPNVTPPETMAKIAANIARTGLYPPLILRPAVQGKVEPPWITVDGWHRSVILSEQGETEADAVIWDVGEREAGILLASLNRLHGEDNIAKRAALIQDLIDVTPADQLAAFIPETPSEIDDLLRITQVDLDALERTQVEAAEREEAEAPRAFTVLLFGSQEAVVRQALESVKHEAGIGTDAKNGDGNALELLAADWLAAHGLAPEPSPAEGS